MYVKSMVYSLGHFIELTNDSSIHHVFVLSINTGIIGMSGAQVRHSPVPSTVQSHVGSRYGVPGAGT